LDDPLQPQPQVGPTGQTPAPDSTVAADPLLTVVTPPPPRPAPAGVPDDLRVGWTWLDIAILAFVGVGCAMVSSRGAAIAVALLTGVQPPQIPGNPAAFTAWVAVSQVSLSSLLLLYLFVQVRLRWETPFWRTLGYRPFFLGDKSFAASRGVMFLAGMALAVLIQIGGVAVRTQKELPIQKHFQTLEGMVLLAALAVLIAPLFEETVFRGYLYPVAARSWGVPAGVLATGALFGLTHAGQLWGGWGEILLLVVVGMVLTYARAATGSVLASYLLHLGYNFMLVLEQFIFTGGFRHLPPGM
jgi:membrane protease YdiL (CAAX protease family)